MLAITPAFLLLSQALCAFALPTLDSTSPTLFPRQDDSNTTTSDSPDASYFPQDVGVLGTMINGSAPFLVETDTINGTLKARNGTGWPVETRWNAVDSSEFAIFESLGNVSPYYSSPIFPDVQQETALPEGCSVSQVHILHRHGARYPTSLTSEGAPHFGAVLKNATGTFNASGPLEFLNTWSYQLGAEVLVPIGRQQLFDSGVKHAYRYGKLYNATTQAHKPVVRTTSQSRMLDSAKNWILGFFGLEGLSQVNLEIILEAGFALGPDAYNNTLASYDTCDGGNNITVGDTYLRPVWDELYLATAVKRLQPYITNLTLDTDLVYGMQGLCAYETVALGISEFCGLFTSDEWKGFEYDLSLQFVGDYGIMSPSGRAQGIGYVQEFLARLDGGSPIDPVTTQNTTLDSSNTTFPTDQPLYVDFTHDDIILSVLTALNYSQVVGEILDPEKISETFKLSHITPFAARLVFEIIECADSANATTQSSSSTSTAPTSTSNSESTTSSASTAAAATSTASGSSSSTGTTKYIRTLINDALIPLDSTQGCTPQTGLSSTLCKLDDFVAFQRAHAVADANFDVACYGVNGTDYLITGPVSNGTVVQGFGLNGTVANATESA